MLSLNSHIEIEFIKKCKKLQEIECENLYVSEQDGDYGIYDKEKAEVYEENLRYKLEKYPAPTIADIIDSAEMLFGGHIEVDGEGYRVEYYKTVVEHIIRYCQQNKPIQEISEYILENIMEE